LSLIYILFYVWKVLRVLKVERGTVWVGVLPKDTTQWPTHSNLTIHSQFHICTSHKPNFHAQKSQETLEKNLRISKWQNCIEKLIIMWVFGVHGSWVQIHLKIYIVRFIGIINKNEGQKGLSLNFSLTHHDRNHDLWSTFITKNC